MFSFLYLCPSLVQFNQFIEPIHSPKFNQLIQLKLLINYQRFFSPYQTDRVYLTVSLVEQICSVQESHLVLYCIHKILDIGLKKETKKQCNSIDKSN